MVVKKEETDPSLICNKDQKKNLGGSFMTIDI